jgi:hypothetical protein
MSRPYRFENQTRRLRLEALFEAQNGFCASCGLTMLLRDDPDADGNSDGRLISEDHLVARKSGGGHDITNRVAMHRYCNSVKGHRAPTGCERIFHLLVLTKLEMIEAAAHIGNVPMARKVFGEESRATLGDLWPKMGGEHA